MLPAMADKGRGRDMFLVAALGVAQASMLIATAFATRAVFAALHTGGAVPLGALSILVGGACVIAWAQAYARVRGEAIGQSYAIDLRRALMTALAGLPAAEYQTRRLGGMSLRFVGDLTAARSWVGLGITRLVSGAIVLPMAALCLYLIHPTLALVGTGPIFASLLLTVLLGASLESFHQALRRKRAGVAIHAMERISVARDLALLNRLPRELKELDRKGAASARDAIRRVRRTALLRAIPAVALGLGGAGILWTTAANGLAAADAAAALSVLAILGIPVKELVGIWDRFAAWRIARAKCNKLFRTAAEPPKTRQRGKPVRLDLSRLRVGPVQLDVVIREGERVRLIGPDADQISDVLRTLANRRAPDSGVIRYGTKPALPRIAYITDQPTVLRGSLRRALTMGVATRPPDDSINAIARECGLDVVMDRIGGLDGRVTEAARNLRPAETLRLAICQAILSKPDLVIIESALWPLLPDATALYETLTGRSKSTIVHGLPPAVGEAQMLLLPETGTTAPDVDGTRKHGGTP